MSQYLGLDFSTQKLKAVVLDKELKLIHESEVNYDVQLPEFRTHGGVVKGENGSVTSPVILWVKALDLILDQMQVEGVSFSNIKAVAGAAQQHGSVYWQKGSRNVLQQLTPNQFLHEQLRDCFVVKDSPVWMDSSTTKYCRMLEEAIGSAEKLAEITGSRAYERFTGPHIAKIADCRRKAYENCERISLISNFACSLFLGDYAEVDYSDASGTNLMDVKCKEWNDECLKALRAPDVKEKLGKPVPPHFQVGCISDYFVKRFGFNPSCCVSSFAGDNPASFGGMRALENDIIVSLGTSDTLFFPLKNPAIFVNGHVFCSAVNKDEYLALLCFKNGSLTRERIRDTYAGKSWAEFESLLNSTPRGNFGNMGLYFDNQEIAPFAKPGDYRWNSEGRPVNRFSTGEIEIRALIEGQLLARRAYFEDMGLACAEKRRIVATGGASANNAILQVLSDVFNLPVYKQASAHSAALGAAYLAKLSVEPDNTFENLVKGLPEPELICKPNRDAAQIYEPMLKRYRILASGLK
ncbi:UNVERIFIED_CONTAM: hypothetical protein PYX00_007865 [Menopon gallinae]|uniref:Xylulose kinase n=1 Tax=Menopon gallinae TaxID=328185 RepID=A0AAW2HKH5_9NEOP